MAPERAVRVPVSTLALAAVMVALAACRSPEGPTPTPQPAANASAGYERPDLKPLVKGPLAPGGYQAILGTADLAVGPNRLGFVLTSPLGLVTQPAVGVRATYAGPGGAARVKGAAAVFRPWPYGGRGMYTTTLDLDAPGPWTMEASFLDHTGAQSTVRLDLNVAQQPQAPSVGNAAPRSRNRTASGLDEARRLTSGSAVDPDLYRVTIEQAVASGQPAVVVFASPAFCTNAVCGPQVEVLTELKAQYWGRASFVHVDIYDDPHAAQEDLAQARISPVVEEWRLPSSEWTFVLDAQGTVAARFESFATLEELEEALKRVLDAAARDR